MPREEETARGGNSERRKQREEETARGGNSERRKHSAHWQRLFFMEDHCT
jgi:hypothetical protein